MVSYLLLLHHRGSQHKVMENYSTSAFLLGFICFSCNVGYPKILFPDEVSQLVKGSKEVQLNFNDIKHKLNTEV